MAATVADVALALRDVLTTTAEAAAHDSGFVRRRSKLTGAAFVQALTFGWLDNPEATLEELAQAAATVGVRISPQGLDQRFTRRAADCLLRVLQAAVTRVLAAEPVAIPILQRFAGGVCALDSTTIALPDALAALWPGCGRTPSAEGQAAVKLQVRLDLLHGTLNGPFLFPGRGQEPQGPLYDAPLPPGALRLADLGFFELDTLRDFSRGGVYWLTRMRGKTQLYDAQGRRWKLTAFLAAQTGARVEQEVFLGVQHRLPARLLAVRVPEAVAQQRRERLLKTARKRSEKVSADAWALAAWTVYVTNVPVALLSLDEALVVARCRWQIELLFKLWKQEGRVDESRSEQPWRVLCEVYAKLLGMVVQHWILLINCWSYADRSLVKAARTVRGHALHLAAVVKDGHLVGKVLEIIQRCLAAGCRIPKRRKEPATYQRLLVLTEPG
jgi:Transposase DDE domain